MHLGVAADSSGNIYVADSGNHRIKKFTCCSGMDSFYPGTFDIDIDGSGATSTVSFVLIDLDSDGDIDRMELSSDDSIFGEATSTISLSLTRRPG